MASGKEEREHEREQKRQKKEWGKKEKDLSSPLASLHKFYFNKLWMMLFPLSVE